MAVQLEEIVLIPRNWIELLCEHSKYLKLLLHHDYEEGPSLNEEGQFRLTLPPLLSGTQYLILFKLICVPVLGGRRATHVRLWNLIRDDQGSNYIIFFSFFGMDELLLMIIEAALPGDLSRSSMFTIDLINHYGEESKVTKFVLRLIVETLDYSGDASSILNKVRKLDGSRNLSQRKLRSFIYSQTRRRDHDHELRVIECDCCKQPLRYYYKKHMPGSVPNIKLAHHKPCCGTPVHMDCFWVKVVDSTHCDVCSTDIGIGPVRGMFRIEEFQSANLTSAWSRATVRAKFGFTPEMSIPVPEIID